MEWWIAILLILSCVILARVSSIGKRIDAIRSDQEALRRRLGPPPPATAVREAAATPPRVPAPPAPPRATTPPPPPPIPGPRPSPAPPAPPPPPSSARRALRRMAEWILVGDEFRRRDVSVEYAVASTWLLRAGIVVIVAGVGWFLKWSVDRDLIGPMGRIALALLAGVAMLAGGCRLFGRRYQLMGQGLLGGGLATLYFSLYAAGPLYGLLSPGPTFATMLLVTATAGLLALRTDSMLVAILGLIGGYCTPLMLRTPEPDFPVLYGYLFLLGLGIFALAHFRNWRLLNVLGSVFTWLLVAGSLTAYRTDDFPVVITSTALLFVLHSSIAFWYSVVRREEATTLEILYLAANAAVFSLVGYGLIRGAHGRPWPALLTLALALYYVGHVWLFLKQGRGDRKILITLIALSGLFAALTMPLVLEKESLTISWALLAAMFLWISGAVGSSFLRSLSYGLYILVFAKLSLLDLSGQWTAGPAPSFGEHLRALADRLWTFGFSIASFFSGFLLERGRHRARVGADQPSASPGVAGGLFYWGGLLFLFVYARAETNALFRHAETWRLPALTVLWCLMAAYFLFRYGVTGRKTAIRAAILFLMAAVLKVLLHDIAAWGLGPAGVYRTPFGATHLLARLLDFGAVIALLFAGWRWLGGRTEDRKTAACFGYGALFLLFVYSTLELNALLFWKMRGFQAGGVSALWALYAMAFVAGGLWKELRPLRIAGLALFAAVVGKVFLLDLDQTPAVYRVLAFLVVGLALLSGAFAYLRAATRSRSGEDR